MNWKKNRYDQLILAVVAVALLAVAVMVVMKTGRFDDRFAGLRTPVIIDHPPFGPIDPPSIPRAAWNAGAQLNPDGSERGLLFVPVRYVVHDDRPVKIEVSPPFRFDSLTGQGIPNTWFINHRLPLEKGDVASQDPDKDGFTNEDEWRAGTDPNDSSSHPPYHTKLFLKQINRTPFHVIASDAGDGKFQVDTVELKQPTAWLKLGEMIPGTHLKLEKFERKKVWDEKIADRREAPELTLLNTETGDHAVLVLGRMTNVPNEILIFDYQWPPKAESIPVRKQQQFGLKPETDKKKLYKLVDIKETEAVIKTM